MRVRLLAALACCCLAPACGADSQHTTTPSMDTGVEHPKDGGTLPPSDSDHEDAGADSGPRGTFPQGFQFGTAIAGFQVDMGCPTVAPSECEDRASDWYQWVTTDRILRNPLLFMSGQPISASPGFYELFERDLDLAGGQGDGQLGGNALRLSIEWSRIFPTSTIGVSGHAALSAIASREGVDYYHRLFAAMKKRGLLPFVTANHYTLPLWIHDGNMCNQSLDDCIRANKAGWANPDRSIITTEIAKYAGFLAEEYGGEVDLWATENEPFSALVVSGYLVSTSMRSQPPGLSGPWMSTSGAKTAFTALVEAHARMYDAIKAGDTKDADGDGKAADVGLVYAFTDVEPLTDNEGDANVARDAKYFLQDMFMDGVVLGRVDEGWDQGPGTPPVRQDIAGRMDFIGVNYYFRFKAQDMKVGLSFVSPFITFNLLRTMDPDFPQGIYPVLMDLKERYGLPMYVTEAGHVQDDPSLAAAWTVHSLVETRRAIYSGADVRGYYVWSLMDNYEWNQGMKAHFGLYSVDTSSKERTIRESGEAFAQIAKSRDVPSALVSQYATYFP